MRITYIGKMACNSIVGELRIHTKAEKEDI